MTQPSPIQIKRQTELELEMRSLGTARFEKMISEARVGKRESETPYGAVLMEKAVLPTAEKIKEWLKKNGDPKQNSMPIAAAYLLVVGNPELAAYITSKMILDGIGRRRPLPGVAKRIASALEDEVRLKNFEGKNKAYFATLKRSLDKRSSHTGYRKRVLVFCMNKAGITWVPWSETDKLHLGMQLLHLFVEATGFITTEQIHRGKNNDPYEVVATKELMEWVEKKNISGSVMQPELLPMIIPPVPWTSPWNGGYLKNSGQQSLVKTRNSVYLEDLNNIEIPIVYSAINAVQATGWQVNSEVLMVAQELWNSGMEIGDTPAKRLKEEPPKPHDIDTNVDAKKLWKRAVNEVKTENIRIASKILQTAKTLAIAVKFKDEPSIFFPHQLDFRGRLYPIPMFLNPQGPDIAKGMLRFSEGKSLETQEAADWLAIHGANCYGVDKVSYEERVAWIEQQEAHIRQSVENPFDYLWWTKADSPWQFLSFCFEWYGYLNTGLDWVSRIPIALDGSCNGLQHFSAMLRDEVGGAAVNLMPSDIPADIYQTVADKVTQEISGNMTPIALAWKKVGVTRKGTKRCVMVLPYGGTEYAFRQFIQEHIRELGIQNTFGEDFKNMAAASFLAKEIHSAIKKTVVKAMEAMDWLQGMAKVAADEGLPIRWTTPSGFPVLQKYSKVKSKQLEIKLSGKRIQLRIAEELPEVDKKRQTNAVSPNFVHSLDASALMETVVDSVELGISSFSMVHDSYGTLARDTSALAACLRSSFVRIYKGPCVLEEFRMSVAECCKVDVDTLAKPPISGSLVIEGVNSSKYFFA